MQPITKGSVESPPTPHPRRSRVARACCKKAIKALFTSRTAYPITKPENTRDRNTDCLTRQIHTTLKGGNHSPPTAYPPTVTRANRGDGEI